MLHLHPHPALHPLFESLAYFVGYRWYVHSKAQRGDVIADGQRWQVIAAAAVGALFGSRALGLLEQAPRLHLTRQQVLLPGGGKTIVGGLLGGWIAVELTKRLSGIRTRTGDLFAIPLCISIAIGRVGCLLAGLADDTYGKPSTLPWAVDFGDGIPRHPTQLYDILFLLALAAALHLWQSRSLATQAASAAAIEASPSRPAASAAEVTRHPRNGDLFRLFLFSYLLWRFLIDFLKPQPLLHGLNAIQWACLLGCAALALSALIPRHADRTAATLTA